MDLLKRWLGLLVGCVLVAGAAAQPTEGPAEKDVAGFREKFLLEREQAVKAKFPRESFQKADDLAQRAEAAAKANNLNAALRYWREARWQLPYLPAGLPEHVTRVLGQSRMRQATRINALSYSPDGRWLASACRDGTVKVWDLDNGREVITYRGHLDQPDDTTKKGTDVLGVTDVAFHPTDPKRIFSSAGNQIHSWDATTGKKLQTVLNIGKTDRPIKSIAFSTDGKKLAVGADDGILRVIESDSGKEIYTSPSRNARIEQVAFSPNGKLVVVGDSTGQIAVYVPEGAGNKLAMSIQGSDIPEVLGVAYSADNASVFSCGRDGKARLTAGPTPDGGNAPNTSTKIREFIGHSGAVTSLAVTADSSLLVTGGEDKTVRVWDVKSAKPIRSFQGHMAKVSTVTIRPDGRQLASGSEDGAIRIWDLSTSDDHRVISDAKDSLWAVAFSPDGQRLATAGADKTIRVYNPDSGKLEATLTAEAALTSLAFLPDNNRLVAGGGDRKIQLWDIAQKKVVQEMTGPELAVLAIAASDDGKLVVAGSADATVRGYNPATGQQLWKWNSRKAACAVSLRKGNTHLAVGLADGTLFTVDVSGSTPKEMASQVAHVAGVAAVAHSHDGTRLASVGGDGAIRIWTINDNGTLTPLVKFDSPTAPGTTSTAPLSTVAFSPDGRFVAAAGADSVVRIWDIQTKSEVRTLRGHTDWITSIAFSPNGRTLASVAAEKDNRLRLFELSLLDSSSGSGGHSLAVNAVAVSPDGKWVATASIDQTIKIWDIETGKEVATLIGNADTPFAIAFTNNSTVVMGGRTPTADSGRLHLWAINPVKAIKTVATGEVYTLVATKDGSKFAAWAARPAVGDAVKNNAYELYDAQGTLISSVTDQGRNIRSATFSADCTWAIAGDENGTLRIWDVANKQRLGGDWAFFPQSFADLGISGDKKYIVAADVTGTVKVASTDKREKIAEGSAHRGGVRALFVSPTNNVFCTVSNDREVKAWSLTDFPDGQLKLLRTWELPVTVNNATFSPDGKLFITANADGTAYVLELP
ncbi:MAG: WD40 repeat domain-containing protein [Gemmataceae bacterium]|nr:WD40 repeat domain-containing protein [Gemmata sp.]MDW8196553.1 WD40 repeat domain-containing protein [Gemmataceae bacterium]